MNDDHRNESRRARTLLRTRRRVLQTAGAAGLSALIAGCLGDDDDEATDQDDIDDTTDADGGDDSEPQEGAYFAIEQVSPNSVTVTTTYDTTGEEITTLPAVERGEIQAGGPLALTVTVRNTGDETDSRDISVSVNASPIDEQVIVLAPEEETTIVFEGLDIGDIEPDAEATVEVDTGDEAEAIVIMGEERHRPSEVGLETLASDLPSWPVAAERIPETDAMYVACRDHGLYVLENGDFHAEPALDLSDDIVTAYEAGVIGVTIHGDFPDDRRCFVRYSAENRDGTPGAYAHTGVLSEFTIADDSLSIHRNSERTILEVPQPQANHNSGNLCFGPDGYLYAALGDGGGGNDQGMGHVDDWNDETGGGNGQDTEENLHGGLLRLDVDAAPTEHYRSDPDAPDAPSNDEGYAIPADNPLADAAPHYPEYYAWGLRNPWGTSFDGDDLYLADVGQAMWEEVNLIEHGGNYGWNTFEGTHCCTTCGHDDAENCPETVDESVPDPRGGEPLIDPIIEYENDSGGYGICVIGAGVYRGEAIPGLSGQYLFGDLMYGDRLYVANPTEGAGLWDMAELTIREEDNEKMGDVLAFAQTPAEEWVVCSKDGAEGLAVHRIVPSD